LLHVLPDLRGLVQVQQTPRTMENRLGHSSRMRNEPIAIIGSACRFPGGSSTPSKLWDLLREPRDVLSYIPSDRFSAEGFYHTDGQYHGHSNVRQSYFLSENVREFDAPFFGVKPVEANATDPQQRLLLETVYEGIESAGLTVNGLRGSKTAVYVGLMCADYDTLLSRDTDSIPTYHATGTARSIISNRISYFFDWRGPSMTIDTACSSSLIAVHQAVQVLRNGDSRVAVAAGSNLILGPEQYIAESKLKMLSPDSRSRMWDADANGYARGEGVAAVILKTLSAALEDGDHIECLIRETGINQDGKTKGITMPSANAQATLIRDTYSKAGLDPTNPEDRCQYFEAHGKHFPFSTDK
jgi:hybrid polyketide synthase/nonribosomal peptide synthetase ACE1